MTRMTSKWSALTTQHINKTCDLSWNEGKEIVSIKKQNIFATFTSNSHLTFAKETSVYNVCVCVCVRLESEQSSSRVGHYYINTTRTLLSVRLLTHVFRQLHLGSFFYICICIYMCRKKSVSQLSPNELSTSATLKKPLSAVVWFIFFLLWLRETIACLFLFVFFHVRRNADGSVFPKMGIVLFRLVWPFLAKKW